MKSKGIELISKTVVMVTPPKITAIIFVIACFLLFSLSISYLSEKVKEKYGNIIIITSIVLIIACILLSVFSNLCVKKVKSNNYKYLFKVNRDVVTMTELSKFVKKYDIKSYKDDVFTVYTKGYLSEGNKINSEFDFLR